MVARQVARVSGASASVSGAAVGGGATSGDGGVGAVRIGSAGGMTLSLSLTDHDGARD